MPLETKRTFSTEGTVAQSSSANSTSAATGAPNVVPRRAASRMASTMGGYAWPRMSGPQLPTRST